MSRADEVGSVRVARAADADTLVRIWNEVIRDTTLTFNPVEKARADVAALIAERSTAGDPVLVVERAGAVCGFAFYVQFRAGSGYRHTMEHTIHLVPAVHGLGLGRRLLTALEDQAARSGVHMMMAGVSGENPGGRAFHLALGYREVAVLPEVGRKFGRWLDLHLLQKRLDHGGPVQAGSLD